MKWLVGVLLLLNVALFLWATGHQPTSGPDSTSFRQPVNPAGMRLLSEVARPEPGTGLQTGCYRVGPFYDQNAVALAGQKLDILRVPFRQRTVKERELRAYRVFVGPYSTESAIETQRNLLRAGGITDHYIKRESEGTSLISLGLFSQKSGADAFVRELEGKRINAQLRTEDRVLGPTFWLELDDRDANRAATGGLEQTGWGDPRANLRPLPCDGARL